MKPARVPEAGVELVPDQSFVLEMGFDRLNGVDEAVTLACLAPFGRVVERTFKSGETVEAADVIDTEMTYLYSDGEYWHFMDPNTFEQLAADSRAIGDGAKWLQEQNTVEVTLFNGEPLTVTPPNFVDLRIVETDPGIRGDTAQGGTKPATLETGAVAKVPLFIEEGELIRVDTRKGEYVSRVKG